MPIQYDKPYKSYEEMLNILEERNVLISNRDVAISLLQSVSYYSIANTNKDIYCDTKDHFMDGTSIENLYRAYIAQKGVWNVILKYIIFTEIFLKTTLAQVVAQNYGVEHKQTIEESSENYLYYKNYSPSKDRRNNILKKIISSSECICDKRDKSSTHYYRCNKNHLPPWILVRDITFGMVVQWYGILMDDPKRSVLKVLYREQELGQKSLYNCVDIQKLKEFTTKAFDLLIECRNALAHGDRPIPYHLKTELPWAFLKDVLPQGVVTKKMYSEGICKNDYIAVLTALLLLLPNDIMKFSLIQELRAQITTYEKFDYGPVDIFKIICMPANYEDILIKIYNDRTNIPIV